MRLIFVNMQHNSSRMFTYLSRIYWHNYMYVACWHNLSCMKGQKFATMLMDFEHGGIYIVPHLLWHGTSVFTVSSKRPPPPSPHQIVSPIWRIAFELKHWYMYSYLIKKKIYTQYNVIFLHFVACKCYFWWRRCNEQCWIPWYQEMAMHKVPMDKTVHLKAFLCPCWALGRIRS